jgi:hypothetical protein
VDGPVTVVVIVATFLGVVAFGDWTAPHALRAGKASTQAAVSEVIVFLGNRPLLS